MQLNSIVEIGGGGTPAYAAPEQWLGNTASSETDIYSLGILLYEALTAQNPFRVHSADALIDLHLHQPLPHFSRTDPHDGVFT